MCLAVISSVMSWICEHAWFLSFFFFNSTSAIDYIGVGIFIFLIYKQVDQGQQNKYEVVLRSM